MSSHIHREQYQALVLKPGDRLIKYVEQCKFIACLGIAHDWTAYTWPEDRTLEDVLAHGEKLLITEAISVFPEFDALGLMYRP